MMDRQQSERKLTLREIWIIRPADWCLLVALLCNFFIFLGEPLKNDTLVRLGSRGLIFSVFGFALLQFMLAIKAQKLKNAIPFAVWVLTAGVSTFFSGPTAFLQHLISLVCFFMLPVSLLLYKNMYNVKAMQKVIYGVNWVYTILWTVLSFSSVSHVYYGEYGARIVEELTLGYANPNQTGIFLMISFIIAFCAFLRDIKYDQKVLYLLQCVWTFVLVCRTQSRACIILSAAVVLVWFFGKLKKIGGKVTLCCFLLPFLVACLLILGGEKVQDFLILGEEFDTGRVDLFNSIFSRLTFGTFLFGNFSGYIGSNLHNSYITIFAVFGVIGFFVYLAFFCKIVKDYYIQINKKSSSAMLAYLGVLAVIAHGSIESTLLTAGMVYGSLVSLLFILTLNGDKQA